MPRTVITPSEKVTFLSILDYDGRHAESLIAEAVLAIEMGALAEDLALTLHPHPTLSETESEAAELFLGNATHLAAAMRG